MNNKGQWIILSGMILAIGLVFLVILLNQAMSAGYRVSAAETDFQSREITEIFEETVRTANMVWTANPDNESFDQNMSYFANNTAKIYAARGVLVEINTTMNASTNIMNMDMHYYDGKVNFTLADRQIQL